MKQLFLLGTGLLILLISCTKMNNTPAYNALAQFNIDSAKIDAYLKANNITNVQHQPLGIFYQIVKRGDSTNTVSSTASIKVGYLGTLLDKTKFDGKDSANFILNKVITGWQLGVPKIGKGGEINLYLPSYFGYGPYAAGTIPANSVLVFNIKLFDYAN